MKFYSIKTLIFATVVFGFATGAVADDTWTIKGKITDSKNSLPVANAVVSFVYNEGGKIETNTDAKGKYVLKPSVNKEGQIVINAPKYNEVTDRVYAHSNPRDYIRNDYKLNSNYFTINGKIVDNVTGNPIEGASVKFVYDENKGETDAAITDKNGKYTLQPQINIGGNIVISCEGYVPRDDHNCGRGSNEVVFWNYEIRKKDELWTIEGKVYEKKTWLPVKDATVTYIYDEGGQTASTTTDANGYYKINPLINKAGDFIISKDNFVAFKEHMYSRGFGGDYLRKDYTMSHDYWTIQGRITDYKTCNPIKDINVKFANASYTFDCKTDDAGFYQMNIKIGDGGKLTLSGDNWITKEENLYARGSDELVNNNYTLDQSDEVYTVYGTIKENKNWDGVENALLTYTCEDGSIATATTDVLGHYTIYPPVGKAAKLAITKDGFTTINNNYSINDSKSIIIRNYSINHDHWYLSGTITDYKTGDGVAGVKVAFIYDEGGEISTITNADGTYSMTPKSGLSGNLNITCDSWKSIFEEKYARNSDTSEIWNYQIHKIKETYLLTGKIFSNEENSPVISGATVEYQDEEGGKLSTVTDANGEYTLYPELNKNGKIRVTANNYKFGQEKISPVSNSRAREIRDLTLEKKKDKE